MVKKYLPLLVLLTVLISIKPVYAEQTNVLPEMLVSDGTKIEVNSLIYGNKTYYGGTTGNFTIYNYPGDEILGFDEDSLITDSTCFSNIIFICFALKKGVLGDSAYTDRAVSLLKSKTYVHNEVVLETPVLFMHSKVLVGDAYFPDYSNFAFWGKGLAIQKGDPNGGTDLGATWQLGNYALNPDAKIAWSGDEMAKYVKHIGDLNNKSTLISSTNDDDYSVTNPEIWTLDNSSTSNSITATAANDGVYPEGRVWRVEKSTGSDITKNLNLNANITYRNKGTIIVNGDLNVAAGVKIKAYSEDSKLGIIVLGNVTLGGNNDIEAKIFCLGDPTDLDAVESGNFETTGNNINIYGSVVARSFSIDNSNIRFFFDQSVNNMPPGFNYLDMPTSKETGNN